VKYNVAVKEQSSNSSEIGMSAASDLLKPGRKGNSLPVGEI
jgi:hypothetical protein